MAVQRTASDVKLDRHVHAVFLDGVYRDTEEHSDGDRHGNAPTIRRQALLSAFVAAHGPP
jgi:hypothetical protein